VNKLQFQGIDFAPTANFDLLKKAYDVTVEKQMPVHVGSIFTSDTFYSDNQALTDQLRKHGTLAVEMESAALYTLAAKFKAKALSILTVSDHLVTGEATTSEERQTTFNQMIEIALETAIQS
jgi:purine-nucleoside phosphorylase